MKKAMSVTVLFALLALPLYAQNQNICSPVGTWYGGSEGTVKYMAFVSPLEGNQFSILWDGAYSTLANGFPVATRIYGEFRLDKYHEFRYAGTALGMLNASTAFPPATNPVLTGVHFRIRMTHCDTMIVVHDFFGGYRWESQKTPFVDPPDFNLAPTPIVETYKRVPRTCTACTE